MRPYHRAGLISFFGIAAVGLAGCVPRVERPMSAGVIREPFGRLADGRPVESFTLTNRSGMQVRILDFGGVITAIKVPDRQGRFADVVLGYDALDDYVRNPAYIGAIIGRYANRIAKAQFSLDGKTYRLKANGSGSALHGGIRGFDEALWRAETFERARERGVLLTHTSPDGDEGFPGTLSVRITFTLNDANELSLEYTATTDAPTVVNLTHHDYFNLGGAGSGDIGAHRLTINASRYTPMDRELIPLGELAPVAGTPLDFRTPVEIGARIEADHPQLQLARGYDHNFVLDRDDDELAVAARVEHPASGRVLEVRTTEPGLQLYTANHLERESGKAGQLYEARSAFCLETQHFPDSPNQPRFPNTVLRPGEVFRSRTVYAFSAR